MDTLITSALREFDEIRNEKVMEKKNGTRLHIVTDEHSFKHLEEEWEMLAKNAESPVYTRHDWLYCWWRHFGRHPYRELYIVMVYSEDQLVGIAPFYIGSSVVGPMVLQRRLYLMGCGTDRNEFIGYINDYGYSDFLDVIAHPAYRRMVAVHIAELLKKNEMNVDLASFQNIADNSFMIREIVPFLAECNIKYALEKTDECPFITLPETLNEYIEQTGPSSRRRKLKKYLNAAGRKYKIEYMRTPEQLPEALDQLIDIHVKRWNGLGYPGVFYDQRHLEFVKDVADVLHRKGQLWFMISRDEKGTSAARMVIYDGHAVYDWLSGFDETSPASKFRPGLGMLSLLIRDAIHRKVPTFELLRGSERYKFDFATESRPNWRLTIGMNNGGGGRNVAVNKILAVTAAICNRITRELKLLHVQRERVGFIKMPFVYAMFRMRMINNINR